MPVGQITTQSTMAGVKAANAATGAIPAIAGTGILVPSNVPGAANLVGLTTTTAPAAAANPVVPFNYAKAFAIAGGALQIYSHFQAQSNAEDSIESLAKAQEADNIKFNNRQALNDIESRSTIDSITTQAVQARSQYKVAKEVITGGSTARLLLQDMRKNELDMKEMSIDIDTQKRIAMRDELQTQYMQREAKAKEIADSVPTTGELIIGLATTAIVAFSTFGVGLAATGASQALLAQRKKYSASSAVTASNQSAQLRAAAMERKYQEEIERLQRERDARQALLGGN